MDTKLYQPSHYNNLNHRSVSDVLTEIEARDHQEGKLRPMLGDIDELDPWTFIHERKMECLARFYGESKIVVKNNQSDDLRTISSTIWNRDDFTITHAVFLTTPLYRSTHLDNPVKKLESVEITWRDKSVVLSRLLYDPKASFKVQVGEYELSELVISNDAVVTAIRFPAKNVLEYQEKFNYDETNVVFCKTRIDFDDWQNITRYRQYTKTKDTVANTLRAKMGEALYRKDFLVVDHIVYGDESLSFKRIKSEKIILQPSSAHSVGSVVPFKYDFYQ